MRKIRRPNCIKCGKKLKFLSEDNSQFKKSRKMYLQNNAIQNFYNHYNTDDCNMTVLEPGYGSSHDLEKIAIGICDDCLTESIECGDSLRIKNRWR